MIMALIQVIFAVIIIGVLWWAAQKLLPLIPLPDPFRTIVYVLAVVVLVLVVLYVLAALLGIGGVSLSSLR